MKHSIAGAARILFLAVSVAMCACVAMAEDSALNMTPSKTTKLEIKGRIKHISISNDKVANANVASDGASVLVTALTPGTSEIRIQRIDDTDLIYNLTVRADLSELCSEIAALLKDVEGVKVQVVGDRVVLDGNVVTMSDYDRVQKIVEAYSGAILNLTKLDRTELNRFVAEAIEKDIGLSTIRVKVSGDTATLEGMIFDPADAAMAMEKAKDRCPKVISLLKLEEVMIETDVYFIMIESTDESSTGFNILKTLSLEATASAGSDAGATYSVSGSLMAKINALAGQGKAKFLARPHLSTKSGATARFHSGGEVFFSVSGATGGGSLEKVEHGIILTVKPVLRGQNRIMNEVSLTVSVPTAKTQGTFSLDKYETSSTAMCKVGESILISGLSQSLETQFKEKTPLLGSIPVLSMFFSEKTKKRANRDLIIVLTPMPVFPTEGPAESFGAENQKKMEAETKK